MVKAYLRYIFDKPVGMVAGHSSNIIFSEGLMITGNSQYLLVLDNMTGEIVQTLFEKNKNNEITSISISQGDNTSPILAAGFSDGDITLWNWEDFSYKCNLNGHKSSVTHIVFNSDASQLVSGSADTTLIVWDILGEQALYKLSGHKNAITELIFHQFRPNDYTAYDLVLSSSKDGLLKLWDLQVASSIQTISSLSNEVSSMIFLEKENLLLVGTNNDDVILLKFNISLDPVTNQKKFLDHISTFKKQSFSKPLQMSLSHSREYLFMLTGDKTVEVYKILSQEQADKKLKRKQKKLSKKQNQQVSEEMEIENQTQGVVEIEEPEKQPTISDRIQYHTTFRLPKKARSLTFFNEEQKNKTNYDLFAISYHNNNIELFSFQANPASSYLEHKQFREFSKLGHRQAVRALALSDNDIYLVSGGGESLKLWSTETMEGLRTFETGHITAARFLPRSRFFLAADKVGSLYLIDIPKGEIIQKIEGAHEASIWSIDFHENPHGFESIVIITGGADRKLKFWELFLNAETKLLQLQELKTLYMKEEVLCAKYAPNGYHYAVSLLDNSIEINFSDSDKLFLQFYGHKLPVTCFDISSDNTILLSGSADKNVKLWGMDYGNCHKSIFAHQDAITTVKFVKDTHYFFSCGKDKLVKYWDGDTYQLVMQFEECQGEVWAFVVSQVGDFFITGSGDKLVRKWKQGKEQVFVQEEEEKRMEKMMIEDYTDEQLKREEGEQNQKQIIDKPDVQEAIKKKFENLKYGEEIMAAIDQAEELRGQQIEYEKDLQDFQKKHKKDEVPPQRPSMDALFGLSIPEYVLNVVGRIKATELENSMKFVHVSYIEKLLYYLNFFVTNNINSELVSRLLFFILQTHESHILNSKKLIALLIQIQKRLRANLQSDRDNIGVNLAAMQFIKNDLVSRKTDDVFSDEVFSKRSQLF